MYIVATFPAGQHFGFDDRLFRRTLFGFKHFPFLLLLFFAFYCFYFSLFFFIIVIFISSFGLIIFDFYLFVYFSFFILFIFPYFLLFIFIIVFIVFLFFEDYFCYCWLLFILFWPLSNLVSIVLLDGCPGLLKLFVGSSGSAIPHLQALRLLVAYFGAPVPVSIVFRVFQFSIFFLSFYFKFNIPVRVELK